MDTKHSSSGPLRGRGESSFQRRRGVLAAGALFLAASTAEIWGASTWTELEGRYRDAALPLLKTYCHECHAGDKAKGDVDLERFRSVDDVRRDTKVWESVVEQMELGEMPPKKAKQQPSAEEHARILEWTKALLDAAAAEHAGDPGPVVLRRLSNAEYTYSVRDLTGVDLDPAREFPVDGAAGEGFMNAGQALVMSPALFGKYLDAAKSIASHAMLLPSGIRFSPGTSRRDWSDETMAAIRAFYGRHADADGRVPLEAYLKATLEWRDLPKAGRPTPAAFAAGKKLNARYLEGLIGLWSDPRAGALPAGLRERWWSLAPADAGSLATEVGQWQKALWTFGTVGHMKPWMLPASPTTNRMELRWAPAKDASPTQDVTLRFVVTDAGDGAVGDVVLWERPQIVAPGREPLDLKDARRWVAEASAWRSRLAASAARSLKAAEDPGVGVEEAARRLDIDADALKVWFAFLGFGEAPARIEGHLTQEIRGMGGHEFVRGWGTSETPSLVANPTDQAVRIPGNLRAHGVAVHPSPTRAIVVGWKSPVTGRVKVRSSVAHAHPECGNGVTWSLEVRQGSARRRLSQGVAAGGGAPKVAEVAALDLRAGDVVSLGIGPRDGNHSCDLTDIDLEMVAEGDGDASARTWKLTADVSGDVLAGNPHADGFGHADTWHFYTEAVSGAEGGWAVPEGSILARWQAATTPEERDRLAGEFQELLSANTPLPPERASDLRLRKELMSMGGPLLATVRRMNLPADASLASLDLAQGVGLSPDLFGRHPLGGEVDARSLSVTAPAVLEFTLPPDLLAGAEIRSAVSLESVRGAEGSVQVQLGSGPPPARERLRAGEPILVNADSAAGRRVVAAMDTLRQWFPAAVCYTKVVPVDEVVTLALFHREDDALKRLFLDDAGRAEIDRLWDELHFVSHDALGLVDAFLQLMEYATQDSNPALFEPMRRPIMEGAEAFRKALRDAEPAQLESVLAFAGRAYRRPLRSAETTELQELYGRLRALEMPHDEALRGVLARVLVSPAFLYRPEEPGPGAAAAPVSEWEFATRLSYFLWSSVPDTALTEAAAKGELRKPGNWEAQVRRMLRDGRVRRLATEFGCQWLHVHAFDELDEKSERHFPEFKAVRGPMYEEAIRFFTDFFAEDRSVLSLLDSDHTFLNEALAKHYGIPGVTGDAWRRVDGVRAQNRGGVLGLGATLAKQSGASRTSPILRGNWVAEVLLGFKLPKPPPNVPQLPEDESATEGLTLRQVVERHSSVPECSGCHRHIDAYGFALEGFDAIGRSRERDAADRALDTFVALPDGTRVRGMDGLRGYLLNERREVFVGQFCRKLLGYALGRGVRLSDKPLLAEMQARLKARDYRVSAALEAVIGSRQFREIRGLAEAGDP